MKKDKQQLLQEALFKKATGYSTVEVTEEYSMVDSELVLSKRKKSTKSYPPDLSALQLLIDKMTEEGVNKYSNMTLEQLQQEKLRLLSQLSNKEEV